MVLTSWPDLEYVSGRRFVLWQAQHQKWRATDDGHASRHNAGMPSATRVHTIDPAWVASVATCFRAAALQKGDNAVPAEPVPALHGGCDGEKSAYRRKGVRGEDRCPSVVAYWGCNHKQVMFVELCSAMPSDWRPQFIHTTETQSCTRPYLGPCSRPHVSTRSVRL